MDRSEPGFSAVGRAAAALVCAVSTASVLVQYAISLRTAVPEVGAGFATVRYFSYFTILSNVLVVAATAAVAFDGRARFARWLQRPRCLGAIALYIAVTGAIYTVILRQLWQPVGLQWWADAGLHYATPVLYLAWWLACVGHGRLAWRDLPAWLLFPLGFLGWTLFRGGWAHEYPYPFLDVAALGAAAVARNAVGVTLLFAALGAVLVALDRHLLPRSPARMPA